MATVKMTDREFMLRLQKAREVQGSETQELIDEINQFFISHGYLPASLVEQLVGKRSKGVSIQTRESVLQGFTLK